MMNGGRHLWVPIAGFLCFALIAILALNGTHSAVEERIFLTLAHSARDHPALMDILMAASWIAEPEYRFPAAVIFIVILLVLKKRREAWFVFVATAGGAALCSAVKAVTMRPRPDLLPHLDSFDSYSFPSGHAWNGMIFYGEIALILALSCPRMWRGPIVAAGMAAGIITGMSRVALGVHWPSDVFAGWLGGASWLFLCYSLILNRRPGGGAGANSTVDP
jgi:membrane-associated phospholipid phosphatase